MTTLILSECVCAPAVSLQYVFYCSLQRCLRCGDEWKGLKRWREVTQGVECVCVSRFSILLNSLLASQRCDYSVWLQSDSCVLRPCCLYLYPHWWCRWTPLLESYLLWDVEIMSDLPQRCCHLIWGNARPVRFMHAYGKHLHDFCCLDTSRLFIRAWTCSVSARQLIMLIMLFHT